MRANLVVLMLEWDDHNREFVSRIQEMEHDIPEDDSEYIAMDSDGIFVTKITRSQLGDIHHLPHKTLAVCIDFIDTDEHYQKVLEEMRQQIIQNMDREAHRLMEFARRLKEEGL